jgi:hypothetical protein
MGPLNMLRRLYPDVEAIMGGVNVRDYDWHVLRGFDVLFVQRPSHPNHVNIVEMAKQNKIPVWIDFDDDLLAIPPDNPSYAEYNQDSYKMSIVQALQMADVVTVSTNHLKQQYDKYNKNIVVIQNALDDYLLKPRILQPQRRPIIMWRGSNTHLGDIFEFRKEILQVYKEFPQWQWFFLGWNPWPLTQEMKPGTFGTATWASYPDFMNLLQNHCAPIHIVPLKDNVFNRSKSNISWLEGTFAGSAVLTPDWEEWDQPGALTYSNPSEFQSGLTRMINGTAELRKRQEESMVQINERFLLSKINPLRYDVLRRLVD